jgi:uncharacterized protein YgbK (DUF1537 family)
MENHLLTPMQDANLVRVLSRQTDGTVGLMLAEQGWSYAIVDAVGDVHLVAIGESAAAHPLITGGSGVAMGVPANLGLAGPLP